MEKYSSFPSNHCFGIVRKGIIVSYFLVDVDKIRINKYSKVEEKIALVVGELFTGC